MLELSVGGEGGRGEGGRVIKVWLGGVRRHNKDIKQLFASMLVKRFIQCHIEVKIVISQFVYTIIIFKTSTQPFSLIVNKIHATDKKVATVFATP